MPVQKGDKITVWILEAEVTDTSDAHGECFEITLPQKDFMNPRKIWLDWDEVMVKKNKEDEE